MNDWVNTIACYNKDSKQVVVEHRCSVCGERLARLTCEAEGGIIYTSPPTECQYCGASFVIKEGE